MELVLVGTVGAVASAFGVYAWTRLVAGDTSDTPEDAISLTDVGWDAPATVETGGRWAAAVLFCLTFAAGFLARFLAST